MSEVSNTTESEATEVIENEELIEGEQKTNAILKAQEIALDAVMDQTERTADFLKNTYKIDEHNPAAGLIDAAQAGVERMTEFQKDLAHRTSDRIETMMERRKGAGKKAQEAIAEKTPSVPVREMTENGVNMMLDDQEELLSLGHKQTRLFLDSIEELSQNRGKGLFKGMAKYTGQAFQNVLDAQERILDINKDYLRANRELIEANTERETFNRMTGFAFDRADDAIETSKQLIELTKEQTARVEDEEVAEVEHGKWYDLASEGIDRVATRTKEDVEYSRELVGKVFSKS